MPALSLQPKHKSVRDYFQALKQFSLLHATHEGTVRAAFSRLLDNCASQFQWKLVEEFDIKRKGQRPLRADGALLDNWGLVRGYWEAKDEADDLHAEVKKKFAVGYPKNNILFQSPSHAILYQHGERVFDHAITEPEAIVDVLRQFFRYQPAAFEQWERAVEGFRETVPQLGQALLTLIEKERKENPLFVKAFAQFVQVCRQTLNPSLSEVAVEKMLAQHILTERIFRKVFDNVDFARRNAVAAEIERVIDALTQRTWNRDKFLAGLDQFYGAIEETAGTIDDFSEKQHFLNTVYERFFQGFDEKTADTHGIVYTPQSIVRFMVRSVDEILKKEFGRSLGDKSVHILDPFVGTGNFLLHVMQQIPKSHLAQKYAEELHANEVMLLPYYIASMNIEHQYAEMMGEYKPFEGLCLVDTFELAEAKQKSFATMTEKNAERVERQRIAPITVIIGNPPYNAGQVNENDNNKNRKYPVLNERVRDTYAAGSRAKLLNKLDDPYVKAFRWASDRLGEAGVLAYVSNNSFLTEVAFDGVRRCLATEYDSLYIVDLGGNVRKNPKLSGTTHNVFGIQVGVAITILVRRAGHNNEKHKARVFLAATDPEARRQDKYRWLDDRIDVTKTTFSEIVPDSHATWMQQGLDAEYDTFIPVAFRTADEGDGKAVFSSVSLGVSTNRDAVVYGSSRDNVLQQVGDFSDAYHAELDRWIRAKRPPNLDEFLHVDSVKWSESLKRQLLRGAPLHVKPALAIRSMYRPFSRMWLYLASVAVDRPGHLGDWLGSGSENMALAFNDRGSRSPFSTLVVREPADLHLCATTDGFQFVPLFVEDGDSGRRENITDWALAEFRRHYDDDAILKLDVFRYVYALLHHPAYRTRYAANLKREFPRVPFAPDFRGFARAGERLIELHVDYEKQPEWRLVRQENPDVPLNFRVERMKLTKNRQGIVYNDFLILNGVPPEAFEYKLGNRSALDWIIDQYQVSTDKRSGIANDPNRLDDPEYIIRLIGQVITVSVETAKILRALPPLDDGPVEAEVASQVGAPPLTTNERDAVAGKGAKVQGRPRKKEVS